MIINPIQMIGNPIHLIREAVTASITSSLFQMVIGPLCQVTIPDIGVMHGRIQDGRGGGPRQPEAGDDQGGEEERERHIGGLRYIGHVVVCFRLVSPLDIGT